MASNHVQPDQNIPNTMFGDGHGHEHFNYHNNLYSHGQAFAPSWTVDPTLQEGHPPLDTNSAFNPHSQSWQHTATSTSASPGPAHHGAYNPPRGYYAPPASTTSTQFQHASAFAGHGLQPYSRPVDPSLVGTGPVDSRAYSQIMPMYSTASPASTIAPAALHPGPTLNGARLAQSTADQVRSFASSTPPLVSPSPRPTVPSGYQMNNQLREAPRSSSGGEFVQSQILKAPKGTSSGNFVIIDYETLVKATHSARLHNFINVGKLQQELPINKTTIPQYVPRKSQNDLKTLASVDPSLRAKITKRQKKSKIHVPKASRPKIVSTVPRAPGSKESPMSPSSESESSDYDSDSSYDSEDEAEPSPLPPARPQDPVQAVRYDTIKAVWLPRNVFAQDESIRKGLKEFWEIIKTIRDRWKTDSDAVKKAAEAKKESELPMLKDRVNKQRDMMKVAVKASIEHGYPDLMRACGSIKPLMLALYQFLAERIRENDYDSIFTKTVFKFLALCTALSSETIEATGLNKVFVRYSKRGDSEIKALVTKINENASIESKKAKGSPSKPTDLVKPTKVAEVNSNGRKEPEPVAGVKRPRPSDNLTIQASKRVASVSTAAAPKESAAAKLGLLKRPGSASLDKPTPTTTGVKPKAHQVVSKAPTSFFSSLQSASKKPGTNNAALAAKKTAPTGAQEKKASVPAAQMAPAKPVFSFAETMANLAKTREPEPSAKSEEKRPPETAEERAKRLRKEERRKLRVTWKPDGVLVEIRTFSRDPSEIPGNSSNVRDVRDGKEKEGLMFKQHMDMMDIDEDDDQPMEQAFFDFKTPTPIDFSIVEAGERERNYEPYGGGQLKVDSPERKVQENREATTLMVHYMVKSDIPPCPREPVDPYTGEHLETTMFGAPDNPKILSRLSRLGATPAPAVDVSAILRVLSQPQQQTQPPPQAPQPQAQMASSTDPNLLALQNILAQTSTSQYQAVPQPQAPSFQQPMQPPVPEPSPSQTANGASMDAILAALSAHNQPQQPQAQPQAPAPQPFAQMAQPAPTPTTDISALLAVFGQTQPAQQAQMQAGFPGYNISNTAGSSEGSYEDPERKRMRDQTSQYAGNNDQANKRQKWNGGNAKSGNAEKKFLYPCRFWKEGRCKKGAECTFRHD